MLLRKIDDAVFDGFFISPGFQTISDWVEYHWKRDYVYLSRVSILLFILSNLAAHVLTEPGKSSLTWVFVVTVIWAFFFFIQRFTEKPKSGSMNKLRVLDHHLYFRVLVLVVSITACISLFFDRSHSGDAIDGLETFWIFFESFENISFVCLFYFEACTGLPPGKTFKKKVKAKPITA